MAERLLIFLDERYALQGTGIYGIFTWLLFALEVAANFEDTALFLTVETTPQPGWPLVAELNEAPVRLVPLPPYPSLAASLVKFPQVLQVFRRRLPEIRQASVLLIRVPSLMGLVLAEIGRALGRKLCFYVAGNVETTAAPVLRGGAALPLWRALARGLTGLTRLAARNSLVFTVGEELAALYGRPGRRGLSPAAVIPVINPMHSLDSLYERSDTCQGEVIRLLRVCHASPTKGLEVLFHSLKILVDGGLPVELDLAGGGAPVYVQELRELAARLGLASRVRFLGPLPWHEAMELYRQADIQVISSLGEGLPRVILEGWSASLPLVATRVGGIPGLVRHGDNGLLVPPGDPEALARGVETIIRDGDLRRRLISRGFACARTHSREQQAARLAAIIKADARGGVQEGDR
jgi:glycosyltransferase involved in cell wall biosynthesis